MDANCYQSVADWIDRSQCRKFGFKNVQAKKVWHGRFGFTSHDSSMNGWSITLPATWNPATGDQYSASAGCAYEPYQPNSDQIKYLRQTVHNTITIVVEGNDSGPGGGPYAVDAGWTIEVQRYTGEKRLISCTDPRGSDNPCYDSDLCWSDVPAGWTIADVSNNILTGTVKGYIDLCFNDASTYGGLGWTIASNSATNTSYELTITHVTGIKKSVSFDLTNGYHQSEDYGDPTAGRPPSTRDITWNNTSFTDVIVTSGRSPGSGLCGLETYTPYYIQTETRTGLLDLPYTSSDVWLDVVYLLGRWDLTDDAVYPWRLDPFYGFGPLVSYDEKPVPASPDVAITCTVDDLRHPIADADGDEPGYAPGTDDYCDGDCTYHYPMNGSCNPAWYPPTYQQMPWFDDQAWTWVQATPVIDGALSCQPKAGLVPLYSGAVLGAPMPAGYQGHFDYNHQTYKCCMGTSPDFYQWGWGARSGSDDPEYRDVASATDNHDGTISIVLASASVSGLLVAGASVVLFKIPMVGGTENAAVLSVTDGSHFTIPGALSGPYTSGGRIKLSGGSAVDPSDTVMPLSATQWTENFSDAMMWPGSATPADGVPGVYGSNPWGAWVRHLNGVCYAQKWAEIKIHRPAVNFFRPCGADRFALKQGRTACAWYSGGSLHTNPDLGPLSGVNCLITSVIGVDPGVYALTGSGGVYSLGIQKQKVRNIPSDVNAGSGLVGVLRWWSEPNSHTGAWAIEGRAKGESFTDNGDGTYTLKLAEAAKWLNGRGAGGASTPGDNIDYQDAGANWLEGGLEILEAIDDTHFKLAVGAGIPSFSGDWYVVSSGAPKYWWFDSDSKGNYNVFAYQHNFRDYMEADRVCMQYANLDAVNCTPYGRNPPIPSGVSCSPYGCAYGSTLRTVQESRGMPRSVVGLQIVPDCLTFDQCEPQVVCFSPNSESFANGKNYWFPFITADNVTFTADSDVITADVGAGPTLDDRYGSLWQAAVEFWIPDPFWQPPNPLCVDCPDSSPEFQPTNCSYEEADAKAGTICAGDEQGDDCNSDGLGLPCKYYYPMRPFVEAVLGPPNPWIPGDTAPTYPSDILFHIFTLAELNSTDPLPPGVLAKPPAGLEYSDCNDNVALPDFVEMPWYIAASQYCCECGDPPATVDTKVPSCECPTGPGRFADVYRQSESVSCPKKE